LFPQPDDRLEAPRRLRRQLHFDRHRAAVVPTDQVRSVKKWPAVPTLADDRAGDRLRCVEVRRVRCLRSELLTGSFDGLPGVARSGQAPLDAAVVEEIVELFDHGGLPSGRP
jgi:hypothetical protein